MIKKSTNNRFFLSVLLCCGLLLICAGCEKNIDDKREKTEFEIDKIFERGPLTVHILIDRSKITIAETLLLEFEATIEPPYEVQMPSVVKVLENFGIIDWYNLGDRLDANDNIVSRYQYRLEPFLSGTYAIPAFTFEFYDINSPAEEKRHELTTEPIDIEVTSLLGQERAELVIADIEGVLEMPRKSSLRWIWILCTAGVIVAVGVWLYLRRKRVEELVRIFSPAHEIAYVRLRALVKDDLIAAGRIKEFYERISDILRHYIEHRFDLRAPERTTEEFLAELAVTDILAGPDKRDIGEFLKHCDLVKFAKYNPTTEQIQQTFDLVKYFIEKTKSEERRIDVTDTNNVEQTVEIGSV